MIVNFRLFERVIFGCREVFNQPEHRFLKLLWRWLFLYWFTRVYVRQCPLLFQRVCLSGSSSLRHPGSGMEAKLGKAFVRGPTSK